MAKGKGIPCACGFDEDDNAVRTCAFHSQMVDVLKELVTEKEVSQELMDKARECLEEGGYLRG